MNRIIPPKIKKNAHIRVVAPSRSMKLLSSENIEAAKLRLEKFGFTVSFGKHVEESDEFYSSSVNSRLEDIHDAFEDNEVDAILSVIGGYNSNQLLDGLNYGLIDRHPKVFCGFSDITAIANAITAKTGLITYIGPHFSSWAMKYGFEFSIDNFFKCCMNNIPFELTSSKEWSDDPWYIEQENRHFYKNDGCWVLNTGSAIGKTLGGHVRCLNALQGTAYWPNLDSSILLLEEDAEINPSLFDRQLQSLIHQKDFKGVNGILIGRFQKNTGMKRGLLEQIIHSKKDLDNIPIIANVDFGHTTPIATLPIGGTVEIIATDEPLSTKIIINKH